MRSAGERSSLRLAVAPPIVLAGGVFNGFKCNGGVPIPLNPLNYEPYLRALVVGMARGALPSPRRFVLGPTPHTSSGFNGLPGVRVPVPAADPNGQPIGGIRFPDLELPLGAFRPVSLSPAVTTSIVAVCGNSGGFTPFAPRAIRRRYSRSRSLGRYGNLLAGIRACSGQKPDPEPGRHPARRGAGRHARSVIALARRV
jgi:hypothetical protein